MLVGLKTTLPQSHQKGRGQGCGQLWTVVQMLIGGVPTRVMEPFTTQKARITDQPTSIIDLCCHSLAALLDVVSFVAQASAALKEAGCAVQWLCADP